MKCFKMVIIKF